MSEVAPRGLGRGRVVSARAQAVMRVQRLQVKSGRSRGLSSRVVVKANFVRVGRRGGEAGQGRVFASGNYMMFRPGMDGEARQGFDGVRMLEPHEVHQRLGEACQEHQFAYRMVMSPDHNFGATSTQEWAANTLRKAGFESFVVFSHAGEQGHTAHPHAHALVFTDQRLERSDFQRLREFGETQAKEIEMRLTHDRHMDGAQWRSQKEAEYQEWKVQRALRTQVKSEGVEEAAAAHRKGRERQQDQQVNPQLDLEM